MATRITLPGASSTYTLVNVQSAETVKDLMKAGRVIVVTDDRNREALLTVNYDALPWIVIHEGDDDPVGLVH